MKIRYITFFIFVISHNVITFEPGSRPKPAAARTLFPEVLEQPDAARARGYKRKTEQLVGIPYTISHEQMLIDYLKNNVPQAHLQSALDVLLRLQRNIIPEEHYFQDLYWVSNDGRDLRKRAKDFMELIGQNRRYSHLTQDPQFIQYLTAYFSDLYHDTEQLRAAIPFAALPAAHTWISAAFDSKPAFSQQWCKELKILERWLETAMRLNDPFYKEGILLLINSLPENHPLITQESCIKSLLFQVTRNSQAPILEALIKKGINVNMRDKDTNQTPLFDAIWSGDSALVKKLLQAGAEVNVLSTYSQTPLDFAYLSTHGNKQEIINLLKRRKAKTADELKSEQRQLAAIRDSRLKEWAANKVLFDVISENRSDLFDAIIRTQDIDLNARDSHENTLLMAAVDAGNLHVVQYILKSSQPNLAVVNNVGQTALAIARRSSHANKDAIIKMLLDKGARE